MSSRNLRDLRAGDDPNRRASVSGRLRTPSTSGLPRPNTSLRESRVSYATFQQPRAPGPPTFALVL